MKRLIALAVITLVALTACGDGDPDLSGGYVRGRRYVPEQTTLMPIQHCTGGGMVGKTQMPQTCWTQMLPITYPDHWDLYLTDGKTKGWTEVGENTYQRCKDELWCNVDGKHPEHITHDS
jgi:hypothetical protein